MGSKTRLLIVDDDETIRRCLQLFLTNDFEVYVASDGQEGLELYNTHKTKIIITDLSMPIMDGDELCRKIRESDSTCKIYAMSGYNNILENSSQHNVGFDEFISKPFDYSKVVELVKQAEMEI
jgi:DNA-binding response OmpR family regulator